MTILYYFLTTLFLIVCVLMILLILIQKGRGGGLSGAFGGGGGNTAFGSKTGDVLTWATSVVFGVFILLAIFLNLVANRIGTPPAAAKTIESSLPVEPTTEPAPSAVGGAGAMPTTQPQ
jgi:preprotein translocase subunit SecG